MSAVFDQKALKDEDRKRKEKKEQEKNGEKEGDSRSTKKGIFKIENYILGDFELEIPPYKKITAFKSFPIEIDDIDTGSIEKHSLCHGATLKCNQGDITSIYTVLPTKKIFLNGNPLAIISDIKPMINIKPFGQCKSMANPTVAAATSANQGRLQKMPCIPNTVGTWTEGISHFLSDEMTPCDKSKCMCAYAGEISVVNVGQKILGTSVGSSSNTEEDIKNEDEKKQEFKEAKVEIAVVTKGFKKIQN